MQEITNGAKMMTMTDDLEKTPTERANVLYSLVKTRVADGTINQVSKRYCNHKIFLLTTFKLLRLTRR